MHHKIAIIIQARAASTRLPNKVILPFYNGLSILEIIIQGLKKNKNKIEIILATTTNSKDDSVADIAVKNNISVFRGDENNVLDRFVKCAVKYNISKIIRVCADNPFLLIKYIDELIEWGANKEFDYISYKNSIGIPVIKTHFGLFAEFVNLSALKNVAKKTDNEIYFEHVTNYIYTHPDFFKVKLIPLPDLLINRNDLRFTCDTIEDFNMLKKLYLLYASTYNSLEIELDKLLSLVDYNRDFLKVMEKGIKQFQK